MFRWQLVDAAELTAAALPWLCHCRHLYCRCRASTATCTACRWTARGSRSRVSGRGAVVWRWADSEPEASEDSCLLSAPPERLLLVLTSLPACPPTPPPRQPTAEMRIKYFDTIPTAVQPAGACISAPAQLQQPAQQHALAAAAPRRPGIDVAQPHTQPPTRPSPLAPPCSPACLRSGSGR